MTLSEQDNGRTVEIDAGDLLTICLKENRSTGHRWAVEEDGGLELISDDFQGGAAMGSSGLRRLEFRAAESGSHELRLKYWQQFAGDESVAQRFAATVKTS
ncbi:MAG: protease inhibitor I42 family protein [Acidobacteriota bacterium]